MKPISIAEKFLKLETDDAPGQEVRKDTTAALAGLVHPIP